MTWLLGLWQRMRSSLWGLPSVAIVVSAAAGLYLSGIDVPAGTLWEWLAYDGGVAGARAVLQVIAGSIITVTSLVFSLTVVALQMAASQYSPRLLYGFVRDLSNQIILAIFLSSFMFALVVLPSVRTSADDDVTFVPELAVSIALVLAGASVGALVYFLHHVTQALRIEAIMRDVRSETLDSIRRNSGETLPRTEDADQRLSEQPEDGLAFQAARSGYVRTIDVERLVNVAVATDVCVRYRRTIGEYVVEGTVLGWILRRGDETIEAETVRDVEREVDRATWISFERSLQEDIGFGLRQLIDIAVKALSPGVNDPTTAVDAIGHLSVALRLLAQRPLGSSVHRDGDRSVVEIPKPTFAEYLVITVSQIAHYGANELAVLRRLLRMLEDLAMTTKDEGRQQAIAQEVDRILDEGREGLRAGWALANLNEGADKVREALSGRVPSSEFLIL